MSSPQSAFSDFATARGAALHRAAYLMVGDEQLAQDLVQEALTKTYVAWPRLRDQGAAEAYCRKAITTTAIGWFRRKGWSERPVDTLPDPISDGPDVTGRLWLWRCVLALPPRQRVALVLRFYVDLTEAQTAEAMDCAVGTVKSQTAAALAKLRDLVRDDELLDPDDLSDKTVTR